MDNKRGFVVEIKEVLSRKVFIRATDEKDALNVAMQRYEDGLENFEPADVVSFDFNVLNTSNN